MNKLSRVLLITSIFAITALFGSQFAAAQSGAGIQVKPAIIEDNVRPGEFYNFSFTFTNVGGADQTFYLSAQDIKGLDNAGLPIFAAPGEATGYELSTWINLPAAPITLHAGQSTTLDLTAQVPMNVSPGAHFGGVFITSQPPKLEQMAPASA